MLSDTGLTRKITQLARMAIAEYLDSKTILCINKKNYPEPVFSEKRGVFVTLFYNNELRGCIGNIEPTDTVGEAIVRNAVSAAFYDPRFIPLQSHELADLKIEVSLLTKTRRYKYATVEELIGKLSQPVKYGVVIEKDGYSATFLPSVWQELPKPEDFLSNLCLKAGLDYNEWKNLILNVFLYKAEIYK